MRRTSFQGKTIYSLTCLTGHLSLTVTLRPAQLILLYNLTLFNGHFFVMAPKSRYLKSVNHKIVRWNTNRPRRLYVSICFDLLFLYFPIFSLNCVCCHLYSADNISVFMYNFIHVQFHVIYTKSYLFLTNSR